MCVYVSWPWNYRDPVGISGPCRPLSTPGCAPGAVVPWWFGFMGHEQQHLLWPYCIHWSWLKMPRKSLYLQCTVSITSKAGGHSESGQAQQAQWHVPPIWMVYEKNVLSPLLSSVLAGWVGEVEGKSRVRWGCSIWMETWFPSSVP